MKKLLNKRVAIIIIFIICAGLVLVKQNNLVSGTSKKIKTVKVEKKDISVQLSASGKVQARKKVDLRFQTSGNLTWVGVKRGDQVKKWQAIASLDRKELEQKLLKTLRDYSITRWDFDQTKEDYQNTLIDNEARRILEKNQFDLDKSIADVEISNISLKYSSLISPIYGIVSDLDVSVPGINITPSTATFTIVDPQSMIFKADVDESDIGKITHQMPVKITLDAFPNEEIDSNVDLITLTSVTTSGGGTAFPIEMVLPKNDNMKYKIGMNGDISIIVNEKKDVLVLPLSAVNKEGNISYVQKLENGQPKKIQIKTGLETDEEIEILEGLSKNSEVALKYQQ
jgi:HlyD family secretion protein